MRGNRGGSKSDRDARRSGGAARRGMQRRRPSRSAVIALCAARCLHRRARRNAQRTLDRAERGRKRSATITISVGKSEDVRTDARFADVTVGDPESPTSMPLTDRSLSILGKKIGTTRVSVYGEGKKLVGVFDVEVSYDTSRLADRAAPVPGGRLRVVLGQRPHHAVGHRAGRRDARQGGVDRQAVRPRRHQLGQVMQPQQVMLEVRFVEASRQAGRELGVQWNVSARTRSPISAREASAQLPSPRPDGRFSSSP